MRVLLISPYPPAIDGIGTYSQSLRAELEALGHETRVVSARCVEPPLAETIGAVRRRSGAMEDALLATIDAFGPDVVHLQFAVAGYAASVFGVLRLLRRLCERGYPIVTTMHEVTRDTDSLRGPGRCLYRALAARTDLAILHTPGAAACLKSLLNSQELPHTVLPHPLASLPQTTVGATELRREFGLGEQRVVLSFGFIDIDKGIQDLVRATALLRREPRFDDVRLVIAGTVRGRFGPFRLFELRDRAYFAFLKRTVRRLGMQDRVTFTGYVPAGAVRSWFELAEVAALAYRRCEASGVANIASAAGAPVIATAVGELTALSVIPELPAADPKRFSYGLARVLDAETDPDRLPSAHGADFAEIAAHTATLYEQVRESPAAPRSPPGR